jgi:anion-transporting  ArsA/GET3 family ATPase
LEQADTAFVLVASPRPDSIDEAVHFAGKLNESGMAATALIINRVQPRFATDEQQDALAVHSGATGHASPGGAVLADLIDNLAGYTAASVREERAYADLVAEVAPAPVSRVPLLNTDVHDLAGLEMVADQLFQTQAT